ncbi:B3/4 domain protein [Aminomonas paucivorans DSM 12260]|uniref:B3/4 domain protein n=1 Tax=Aminomonas paucivorans DSM 12260 TaxID=584708 RepID=E3CX75_9BACT|nr:phenylalanine--tRNA ligase beta subunit-related protein [Aminomonas paucivorans]EFQ24422.1 B3/4 domain protein [Aminomonas paucivorans DSM 12260]
MNLRIDAPLLATFPEARVGWLVASVVPVSFHPEVERLKSGLEAHLNALGLDETNLPRHPDVARWRETYSRMGVKPSKYRSSLEALARRVLKHQGLWDVSDVVDGYNALSVRHLLPMGAHDVDLLSGDLTLRFGREGEVFQGLGDLNETVDPRQVVYADEKRVCCWLWNHRDCRDVVVSFDTRRALFLVDQAFPPVHSSPEAILGDLESLLLALGHHPEARGVLSASCPETPLP